MKILAWIMLTLMGIGALIDLAYAQLYVGVLNAQLVVGSIIGVGLAAGLIVVTTSGRVTDLFDHLHLKLRSPIGRPSGHRG